MLRNHGMQRRYYHDMLGYNFRMTRPARGDRPGADGPAGRVHGQAPRECGLPECAYRSVCLRPRCREGYGHVWHQYTIRVDGGRDRDAAVKQLNEAGVGTGIFYPVPAHQQDYLSRDGWAT